MEVRAPESHNCFRMSNMAERRGTAALLLLMCMPLVAASRLSSLQVPGPAKIHIRLADLAVLPDKLRSQSEATVRALYRKAGLEIDFVNCPPAPDYTCSQAPGPGDLWVQIQNKRPKLLHGDTTGFAILVPSGRLSDSYAVVSFPMVEAAARELDAPVADVLAASLAHEIGHLLLHSPVHTRSGIMSPRLDRRQMLLLERGELGFTPEETARLATTGVGPL